MSQWDVFKPSSGPLMVRHSMDQGAATVSRPRSSGQPEWSSSVQQQQRLNSASNTWMFTRHNPHPSRVRHFKGLLDKPICSVFDEGYESQPSTPLHDDLPLTSSHNGFSSSIFTRHTPHPNRVRHITGLWGAPICTVFDEGYANNPRYSLPFPPDTYNQAKLRYYGRYKPRPAPGSASINVNAPLLPIDTLTGLLKYTDKRHFQMTADVSKLPLGPPSWREEARAMVEALGLNPHPSQPLAGTLPALPTSPTPAPRLPTPGTATGSRPATGASQAHMELSDEEKAEIMMLQALCQLLKTKDVRSAQEWLVAAPEREKALVVDMLRTSLSLYADLAGNADVTTHQDDVTKPPTANAESRQPYLGLRRAATSGDLFNYQSEVKPTVRFANNRRYSPQSTGAPQAQPSSPPPRLPANQAPPTSPTPKKAGSVSLRYTKAPITQADIMAKIVVA